MRSSGGRLGALLAVVLLVGACGAQSADAPVPSSVGVRSGVNASTTLPRETPAVVTSRTIAIDDPKVGALTFDALVAGDPELAHKGRLVLFLHGFPETAESYRELLPKVADAGYFAVAYDQRGYSPGARPTAVEAYAIAETVGDLRRVADTFGADTFHLVGHDWGGGVVWVAAGLYPERVRSLMALSTPHPAVLNEGIGDPTNPQSKASAYMQTFRAPGSEDRMLSNGAASFKALFGPGAGGIPADKVERYAEVLATPDAMRAALNWYRANPMPLPVTLGPVSVPTVYVWGTEDGAFVRGSAEATAAHVTGPYKYVEVRGKGHWLPEDAPDEILRELLPQLRETTST